MDVARDLSVCNYDVRFSIAVQVADGNGGGSYPAVMKNNGRSERAFTRIHKQINRSIEFVLGNQIELAIQGDVRGND